MRACAFLLAVALAGCATVERAAPTAAVAPVAPAPEAAPPPAAQAGTPPAASGVPAVVATPAPAATAQVATPAPVAAPPPAVTPPPIVTPPPVVVPPVAAAPPVAKPAPPPPAVAKPAPAAPPAAAKPAAPALDLKTLEARLRETKAIGVMTKLALKNQVDDLLDDFRDFYKGKLKTTLAELRRSYDLLVLKVLALLQDADPPLATAIASSREALWGILADPVKFANV